MAAPVPGTPGFYQSRATPLKKPPAGGRYFTFRNPPQKKGYAPGDVLKLGAGQKAQFSDDLGWSAVKAVKTAAGRPAAQLVKKPGTPQGSLTQIESMDQIEARVKRLADDSFTRQQGVLDTQAAKLKQEAEGRRIALQNAYATAAQMNANLGTNVQGGWNEAARTIQGLANTGTGATAEGLQADLATQEQALSRVGAGGTGFDARSQAGVEAYRGGTLPGEFFARQGGSGNQWMNQNAIALNQRGLQEGILAESEDRTKAQSNYDEQLAKLQTGRADYETDLRKQLLGARQDQIDTLEKAAAKVADIRKAQSDLRYKYWNAKNTATTKAQLQQIEMINKQADRDLKLQMNAALEAQRYASANLSDVRAQDILTQPPGGAPKPPGGASVSAGVARASKMGDTAIDKVIANIVAKAGLGAIPSTFEPKVEKKQRLLDWQASDAYKAKVQWATSMKTKAFGSAQRRVYEAIRGVLKPLGYTDAQLRQKAYEITSARIPPPAGWIPGVGPAKPGAVAASNPFASGINLNPGERPGFGA